MLSLSFLLSLTDNVKALFDAWFIGDTFLQDLAQTYETIRQKAEKSRGDKDKMYLLQYYNVKTGYKRLSIGVRRASARILNSLIDLLNEEHKLPRFLVVIVDKDLIADTDIFDGYASKMINDMIHWLV